MRKQRREGHRFARLFGQFVALEKYIDVLGDPSTSFLGESEIGLGGHHSQAYVLACCPHLCPFIVNTPQSSESMSLSRPNKSVRSHVRNNLKNKNNLIEESCK